MSLFRCDANLDSFDSDLDRGCQPDKGVVEVLINLNNETGQDFYSVEPKDDVGKWVDSFFDLTEALHFVATDPALVLADDYFRDTRSG